MLSLTTKSHPAMKQRERRKRSIVAASFASIGLWVAACTPSLGQAPSGPASGYYVPSPYGSGPSAYAGPTTSNPNVPNSGNGPVFNASPVNGPTFNGPTFNGPTFNGQVVNGQQIVGGPAFPNQGSSVPNGYGLPAPGVSQPVSPQQYPQQQYPQQQYNNQPYIPPPTFNNQPLSPPAAPFQTAPSLDEPWKLGTSSEFFDSSPFGYNPKIKDIPVDVYVQEGQTGRFSIGGSVNSDLGVAGNFVLEERNFDIRNWPGRPSDLLNGAFRGAGQNFRAELVPGNRVQRYTLNWTEPNLFGYSPFSLSVGGFYFTRIYRDWTEQRLGARVAVGYEVTPDLSLSTELRGEDVKISDLRITGLPALDRVAGSNDLYAGRVRLAHNTRDSPFLPTEGHLLELIYDQTFGEFDYPRGQVNFSRYFLVRQRADGGGRHTFTSSIRLGFSGVDTPLFENFFAGGFSTMRGFAFRGASPVDSDVQVGGRFQMLGTFEYMMPITADDMLRMVGFVDYGTVEKDIEINSKNFRVAPGFGARIAVPALGPAPLAFDFAFPVSFADTDTRQIFSFTMGLTR